MEDIGENEGSVLEDACRAFGITSIEEIKKEEPESDSDFGTSATNLGIPEMKVNEDGSVDVIVAVRVKEEEPESNRESFDKLQETILNHEIRVKQKKMVSGRSSKAHHPLDPDPEFHIVIKSESETVQSESVSCPSHSYGTRACTQGKKFVCDECGSRFKKELSLQLHEEHHQQFLCSHCSYKTKRKKFLRNHIIGRHIKRMIKLQQGKREYPCAQCEFQTWRLVTLEKHIKMVHLGDKPYSCSQCEYKCMTRAFLKSHFIKCHPLIHHSLYSCAHCGYTCKTKSILEKHVIHQHIGRWYFCDQCDSYKSRNINNLKKHIKCVHGERLPCPQCDYKTVFPQSLKAHISGVHEGEKPFACDECDYKTYKRMRLSKHKMIHTDERPFPCSMCNYRARDKSHLNIHVRTHTGEKPYSCELCDYRSTQKFNITIHMKSHNRKGKEKTA